MVKIENLIYGRVAQLDRVPGYEPGGRRFESSRVRHFLLESDISRQAVGFFVFKTWSMRDLNMRNILRTRSSAG